MKLRAKDQLHVSAAKSDVLRPGEEFVVSDSLGDELIAKHPDKVEKVGDDQPGTNPAIDPIASKSESDPKNKAEPAHADKAAHGRKAKRKAGEADEGDG